MEVCVYYENNELKFDAEEGERLLLAGLRQGVALPYGCATGTCGECAATCIEGRVVNSWPNAPGLSAAGKAENALLLCQSRAEGHCVIKLNGRSPNVNDTHHRPGYVDGFIKRITALTEDVRLMTVRLDRTITFAPGQFMLVNAVTVPEFRAYSIVENQAGDVLNFIIKKKRLGGMSEWLWQDANVGSALRLFGPLGRVCLRPEIDGDLQILAGASGLSMALSVLEGARASGHLERHRADVIFGVRSRPDLFLVERLADTGANITIALSEEHNNDAYEEWIPGVRITAGFVHESIADSLPAPKANTVTFLAGPPTMIDCCLRELIITRRMSPLQVRYDRFS